LLARAAPPVPALVPTAVIVALAQRGGISVAAAREALGRVAPSVRTEVYEAAMQELREMEETEERKR
jgi:hypothetical protein